MIATKRKLSSLCPQCDSRVERFIINIDCEISMCESVNCSYPFNEQSAEGLNIETPNTSFIRYSKTNSKSSLSNTVAMPTPDDNIIAKSVKRARTDFNKPVSSSSSEKKQKDKLHFTKSSDSDVSLATPPTHPAKYGLQINTFTQADTSSNNEQPKTKPTTSFTPPPETNDQEPKSSASSTTTTSPSTASSSSSSAMNLFDFTLPSPTSSIFGESLLCQSTYNITQKSAPAAPVVAPASGLCLPPMATIPKILASNTPSIHDYTLGDIESLLTIDNVNSLSQNNAQPEELSWMEDYNDLFM